MVRHEHLSCKGRQVSIPEAQTAARPKEAGVTRLVGKVHLANE
jgi:hypothetical protein